MDPRAALIAAMMAQQSPQQQPAMAPAPPQLGMAPASPLMNASAAPPPPQPQQLALARLGQLALQRNLANRGLPAPGSPSTPFAGMSTQPIPLQ